MPTYIELRKHPELLHPKCNWVVLENDPLKKKATYFFCRCSLCGKEKWVQSDCLRDGRSRNCRQCTLKQRAKARVRDLRKENRMWGNWEVQKDDPKFRQGDGTKRIYWLVKCVVHGIKKWVSGNNLTRGKSSGCSLCGHKKSGDSRKKRAFQWLFTSLMKSKWYEGLTYKEFLDFTTETKCHYCGEPLVWLPHRKGGRAGRSNLDRKDTNQGYRKSNIVVCCPSCNRGKSNQFTYDQWLEMCKPIRERRQDEELKKLREAIQPFLPSLSPSDPESLRSR